MMIPQINQTVDGEIDKKILLQKSAPGWLVISSIYFLCRELLVI